jgi:hypothetical protein
MNASERLNKAGTEQGYQPKPKEKYRCYHIYQRTLVVMNNNRYLFIIIGKSDDHKMSHLP